MQQHRPRAHGRVALLCLPWPSCVPPWSFPRAPRPGVRAGDCIKVARRTAQPFAGNCTKTGEDHRDLHDNRREPQGATRERHRTTRKAPGGSQNLPGLVQLWRCQKMGTVGKKLQKIAGERSPAKRLLLYLFVSSIASQVSNQGHSRQAPSRTIPSRAMCIELQPL